MQKFTLNVVPFLILSIKADLWSDMTGRFGDNLFGSLVGIAGGTGANAGGGGGGGWKIEISFKFCIERIFQETSDLIVYLGKIINLDSMQSFPYWFFKKVILPVLVLLLLNLVD